MDLGESLFAEVILINTNHGVVSLVTLKMMERDKNLSIKMRKINPKAITAVSICRCAGDESTQYLRQLLSPRLHVAQRLINCYATGFMKLSHQ